MIKISNDRELIEAKQAISSLSEDIDNSRNRPIIYATLALITLLIAIISVTVSPVGPGTFITLWGGCSIFILLAVSSYSKKSKKTKAVTILSESIDVYQKEQAYLKKKNAAKKANILFKDSFKVAGVAYRKDQLNLLIKSLVDDFGTDYYGGLSNKDIEEYGYDKVWKYEGYFTLDVNLATEPDNEHDHNAVKVIANGYHVGYIPATQARKIKVFLDNETPYRGMISVAGGPFKYFDYLEDKVRTDKTNISLLADITFTRK